MESSSSSNHTCSMTIGRVGFCSTSSKKISSSMSEGTVIRGGGRLSIGGGGGGYMGKGGRTRFLRMAETGSGGTGGIVVGGGVGRGRSGRAFEKRLRPRGLGASTGSWDATSGERMIESGRAGGGAEMMEEVTGEYREMKSSNWRV